MVLQVSYDLRAPGQNYDRIGKAIELAADDCIHAQGSVWLVDTGETPRWWRDHLAEQLDANDVFIVTRVQERQWAGLNMAPVGKWLNNPARRW